MVANQTIVPVSRSANTGDVTVSADVIAANTTTFPFLSALAARYDKVRWHRITVTWIPALPTTAGGTISMYFDSDRKDPGATNATDAMQNIACRMTQVWQTSTYRLNRRQLRSNELFTTASGADATAANAENTFASPGRFHVVSTAITGATFTTATVIGYMKIDFSAELLFPSAPSAGIPTRVPNKILSEPSFCGYDSRHVRAWQNFAAGCQNPPTFYQFLGMFDPVGNLILEKAVLCSPDQESLRLNQFNTSVREGGMMLPFTGTTDEPWEGLAFDLLNV